jgi:hypothetical protein
MKLGQILKAAWRNRDAIYHIAKEIVRRIKKK